MKCPHCLNGIHFNPTATNLIQDRVGMNQASSGTCPECRNAVIYLKQLEGNQIKWNKLAYPKVSARSVLPGDVPEEFANIYKEASLVLADSETASAALSRRCLQHLLREKGGVAPQALSREIDEIIPRLPSHLA